MVHPSLSSKDLQHLSLIFGKPSDELSRAAGYTNTDPYTDWQQGRGAPTVNEYFAITNHCGLTPSEAFDLLTNENKEQYLLLLYKLAHRRQPVILIQSECP